MKKTDLAYAAGLIDGEGCINIAKNHKINRHFLQVAVVMRNGEIPQRLHQYFGGTVTQYSRYFKHLNRHSHYWRWVIWNHDAGRFLKNIEPYLILKVPQALIAHQFCALLKSKGGSPKGQSGNICLTPEEIARRDALYIKMKELHQNG